MRLSHCTIRAQLLWACFLRLKRILNEDSRQIALQRHAPFQGKTIYRYGIESSVKTGWLILVNILLMERWWRQTISPCGKLGVGLNVYEVHFECYNQTFFV
jgi:hypothetical protein